VTAEPESFLQFIEARERALQRTAWLLTGDWALAEDLVQTALARSWPRWHRFGRDDDPEIYVRWPRWARQPREPRPQRSMNGKQGDATGCCRECEKPLPHRRRKPLPAWANLLLLVSGWVVGIWILLLLTMHH